MCVDTKVVPVPKDGTINAYDVSGGISTGKVYNNNNNNI
jgi:hypothetical protein